MDPNNVDFTSDLNGTGDTTVSVNESNVSNNGPDAVDINNQRPAGREPAQQAQKVDTRPAPADKALSLRDQISTALKGDGTETPAAAQLDGGQPRGPDGKFAPKTDPAI